MKHNEGLKKQMFDLRLVNWNLKRGEITEAQLKEHMESLNDVSQNAKSIEIQVEEEEEISLN